jgi:hypothetical protein
MGRQKRRIALWQRVGDVGSRDAIGQFGLAIADAGYEELPRPRSVLAANVQSSEDV